MDLLTRQRTYPTTKQKRKLIAFVAQHPALISCKVTQDFSRRDSQILWNKIAAECNSLPGARKTWRQWRKTWQDIRSNVKKKQQERNGEFPTSITKLSMAEKEALGLKNVSSTTSYQDTVEFVAPEDDSTEENLNSYNDTSLSDPESPPDLKIEELSHSNENAQTISKGINSSSSHSDNCVFNCDRLAVQDQRKIQIKEDYYNFKKDYLRQKLLLIKEQTDALKSIAKGLAK